MANSISHASLPYPIKNARYTVLVPYLDADGWDDRAHHLWTDGDDGACRACLRVFGPGVKYDEASLGRIATAPEARGTGLGHRMMTEALKRAGELTMPATISVKPNGKYHDIVGRTFPKTEAA